MKYIAPEVELKILMSMDVITASTEKPKEDQSEMEDDEW